MEAVLRAEIDGSPSDFQALAECARSAHTQRWLNVSIDTSLIPSHSELVLLARARSSHKAHGLDKIPGCVWHDHAVEMVSASYELFLKIFLCQYEPISWRGFRHRPCLQEKKGALVIRRTTVA